MTDELGNAMVVMAAVTLASLFLAAGYAKTRDSSGLGVAIAQLTGLDERRSRIVAPAVVTVELGLAALLALGALTGWGLRQALAASAGLLVVYTGLLGWHLARGRRVVCNCFGARQSYVSSYDLARNLVGAVIGAGAALVVPGAYRLPAAEVVVALILAGVWVAACLVNAAPIARTLSRPFGVEH